MLLRNPVITGTGIICAAGCGASEVWNSVRLGQSGLGPLTLFSSPRYAAHAVGQVRADLERLAPGIRGSRSDKLAWIAAREAIEKAAVSGETRAAAPTPGIAPDRAGVVIGTTVGGMLGTEHFVRGWLKENRRRFGPLRFHECAGPADLCARMLGLRGPCSTVSTACSAGAMAIAWAAELIESGAADWMLAGGTDSLSRLTLNGFGSLLLLDPSGCRPFDARRAGISLGEGAAMLVIEAEETARARGARILARLSGWGASCDAWHATAPQPDGRGAALAMRAALDLAGVPPEEIDFVSAHGTGTPDNDAMEARALRAVFNDRVPPVASFMRYFGHTLAASGAIKAALAVRMLREQAIPASAGCEQPDPGLGFVPPSHFADRRVGRILSNSFGFGGNNVALVIAPAGGETARPTPARRAATEPAVAVLGVGVVSPLGCGAAEAMSAFGRREPVPSSVPVPAAGPGKEARVWACPDFPTAGLIDPERKRRLSRLQQMAVVAARQSLLGVSSPNRPERAAVAFGTGLGSLNETAAFVENLFLRDERAPRPAQFANSVHNSLAAQVVLELGFQGLNATAVHREISFESALCHAAGQLRSGRFDLALAGAADELNPYALACALRWDPAVSSSPPLPAEGCVVVSLSAQPAPANPLAWVSPVRLGRYGSALSELDPAAEAAWIEATLAAAGRSLSNIDFLLTNAGVDGPLESACLSVARALSSLRRRDLPAGSYRHATGSWHSVSGFALVTAIGLLRGEISSARCRPCPGPVPDGCREVLVYTLAPSGTKAAYSVFL